MTSHLISVSQAFPAGLGPLNHLASSLIASGLFSRRVLLRWNSLRREDIQAHREDLTNATIICMEAPAIGRETFHMNGATNPDASFYRLAIHDASVLNPGFGLPVSAPPDRIRYMLEVLGLALRPWRRSNRSQPVVYAMGHPRSTALKGLDLFEAAYWDLMILRRATRRKVIVTLHPTMHTTGGVDDLGHRCDQELTDLNEFVEWLGYSVAPQDCSTLDLLQEAHALVCHTSLVSFYALLCGIPVVTLNPGNFQSPICTNSLWEIEDVSCLDRMAWWARLAYAQWSWQEIADGRAVLHLASTLSRLSHEGIAGMEESSANSGANTK